MSLGHYLWKNTAPGKGYGKEIDIDVDKLPKTSNPPNIQLPNLHVDDATGLLSRCTVPNFYLSPDGRLYHSTNYGSST